MSKCRCCDCGKDVGTTMAGDFAKSSLKWKISECDLNNAEALFSQEFEISGSSKKLYLVLYPQGKTDCKEYMAVYLQSDSVHVIEVSCMIHVIGGECFSAFDREKQNFTTGYGWFKFISRKKLQRNKTILLPNGELTLSCVVTSFTNYRCCECDSNFEIMPSCSRGVVGKSSLMWKISKFSKKKGHLFFSPKFKISGTNEMVYLSLYPKRTIDEKDYIAVFLGSVPFSGDEVSACMAISIVNINDRNGDFTKCCSKEVGTVWNGWEKFISREELFENRHLLPNDELTLSCVVNWTDQVVDEELTKDSVGNRDSTSNFKIDPFSDVCNALRGNKDFTDAVLKAKDVGMPASTILLKACSAVVISTLRDMKSETNAVASDMEVEVPEEFLSLMRQFDDVDIRLKLLSTAHKSNIPVLQVKCLKNLKDKMSETNVIDTVIKAHCLGDQELYEKCLDFIIQELPSEIFFSRCKQKLESYPKVTAEIAERYVKKMNMCLQSSSIQC